MAVFSPEMASVQVDGARKDRVEMLRRQAGERDAVMPDLWISAPPLPVGGKHESLGEIAESQLRGVGAIADGEDPGRPDVSIAKGGATGLRPLSATDRGH